MKRWTTPILSMLILSLLCNACAKSRNKDEIKDDPDRGSAECRAETEIQSSCLRNTVFVTQDVTKIDKVDLLFVIDNTRSMEQEQTKLRDQIPTMIKVLATGDKTPDDGVENKDFPPVKDLHLAVVSSDMGLPGISPDQNPDSTGACNGTGDDGNFLNDTTEAVAASVPNCGNYPLFLEHVRAEREEPSITLQRAVDTAAKFSCISTLGVSGCGFEMQLESPLKALWPSQVQYLTETHLSLGISFVAGSQGRGDSDHIEFLRGTPYHPTEADKLSLLAIVVVTDEEDCSAGALGNLEFLSLNFPGGDRRDLSLRCYNDTLNGWGNKYPVERYINGFKALRPEFSDLVVFAAIAGIPPDIEEDADGNNDITPEERELFYDNVLNHTLMQEVPNPETNNLTFACQHKDPNSPDGFDTQAFPARRITEVARGFGENGVIRSICADDFTPAMKSIIDVLANKIGGVCLPQAYTRDSQGIVGCDIIWTMPAGYSCDEYQYLSNPPEERPQVDEKTGRKRCVVNQIPVVNPDTVDPAVALEAGQLGWYYDDFSADMKRTCKLSETITTKQRISFTLNPGMNGQKEDPPEGVSIGLECLTQIPTSIPISDKVARKVGVECVAEDGDKVCPSAAAIEPDDVGSLFCHDTENICAMYCKTDDDCEQNNLADWVCDKQKNKDGAYSNGSSFPVCVNPICEIPEGEANNCGNSDVGKACIPMIENRFFNSNDIYIETNSTACETRICGVFGFEGDPREVATKRLQDKVYCTCRCRSSDPDISTCKCPDGFECSEDILSSAGPAAAGGYCIREND